MKNARPGPARGDRLGETGLAVEWALGDGATLRVVANLGARLLRVAPAPRGRCLIEPEPVKAASSGLPAWYVAYHLAEAGGQGR